MTAYNEKTGKTPLTGATDAEGDPILMKRVGTTLPGGGSGGTTTFPATVTLVSPTSAITTVSVAANGTVTIDDGGDPTSLPALAASNVTLGTFQFTLADAPGAESAVYTATVTANGVATLTPSGFVAAGQVARWQSNLGIAGNITSFTDQISSKVASPVGAPTVGTFSGGTITQSVVIGTNQGFTCADLTGFPTGAQPRCIMYVGRPTAGQANFCLSGYGTNATNRAFTIAVDANGELCIDVFTNRYLLGIHPTGQLICVHATYDGTTMEAWVGLIKVLSVVVALDTGSTRINIGQSFSNKTTTQDFGAFVVWGRVLTAAEIATDNATARAFFTGTSATLTPPATPVGSAIGQNDFTVSGATATAYGIRLWANRTPSSLMTEAELLAGTSALAYGMTKLDNASTWSLTQTGATTATGYYANVQDFDMIGGKSAVVQSAVITTTGSALPAPTISAGTITLTSSTASIPLTSDQTGTYDLVLLGSSQAFPSADQVEAHTDGSNAAPISFLDNVAFAAGTNNIDIATLAASTAYRYGITFRNTENTRSTVLTGTFTTSAASGLTPMTVTFQEASIDAVAVSQGTYVGGYPWINGGGANVTISNDLPASAVVARSTFGNFLAHGLTINPGNFATHYPGQPGTTLGDRQYFNHGVTLGTPPMEQGYDAFTGTGVNSFFPFNAAKNAAPSKSGGSPIVTAEAFLMKAVSYVAAPLGSTARPAVKRFAPFIITRSAPAAGSYPPAPCADTMTPRHRQADKRPMSDLPNLTPGAGFTPVAFATALNYFHAQDWWSAYNVNARNTHPNGQSGGPVYGGDYNLYSDAMLALAFNVWTTGEKTQIDDYIVIQGIWIAEAVLQGRIFPDNGGHCSWRKFAVTYAYWRLNQPSWMLPALQATIQRVVQKAGSYGPVGTSCFGEDSQHFVITQNDINTSASRSYPFLQSQLGWPEWWGDAASSRSTAVNTIDVNDQAAIGNNNGYRNIIARVNCKAALGLRLLGATSLMGSAPMLDYCDRYMQTRIRKGSPLGAVSNDVGANFIAAWNAHRGTSGLWVLP